MHRLPHPPVHRTNVRRPSRIVGLSLGALALILTACAAPGDAASSPTTPTEARGHGYVEGASELPEPQLHLATADATGLVELTDLLSEDRSTVAQLGPLSSMSGDGRFVAAQSDPPGTVTVIDTGVWTVDHGDHQHYYRAEARVVGELEGQGVASIVAGATTTTVRFADSGETMLLDTVALGTGEVAETGTITTRPGAEGIAVPIGETVLATDGQGALALYDASGNPLDAAGSSVAAARAALEGCSAASGSITTNVGVVVGCTEGALLAVVDRSSSDADPVPTFEAIPYPGAVAASERAWSFHARPGRPTVAAVAGATGAWLLDTRERSWSLLPTEVPLQLVSAVDDREQHVVAVTTDGRVLVLDGASGATAGATGQLLTTEDLAAGVQLEVDQNRAYLNRPSARTVEEVDYADAARIARSFIYDTEPAFLAETGR
ncbi:ABC transporter [Plantibacter flavus]|uniref:ABC transporter n=1 Tax=Plantibacter flavus TaxID=150123 RepID=UPI003F13860F